MNKKKKAPNTSHIAPNVANLLTDMQKIKEQLASNPPLKVRTHNLLRSQSSSTPSIRIKMFNEHIFKEYYLKNITHLDLSYCRLAVQDIEIISVILRNNSHITTLNLSGNALTKESIESLGKMLKTNKGLTDLILSNTQLDDNAISTLGIYLYQNTNLTHINLENNQIGDQGIHILCSVIRSYRQHPNPKNVIWLLGNNCFSHFDAYLHLLFERAIEENQASQGAHPSETVRPLLFGFNCRQLTQVIPMVIGLTAAAAVAVVYSM